MAERADDKTSLHVRRAVAGSRTSLEWVVARFHPFLLAQIRFRLGRAGRNEADVDDLASQAWIVVLGKIGRLESAGGRFAPVLGRFLSTTAINLCNRFLRDRIRRNRMTGQKADAPRGHADPGDLDRLAASTRDVVSRIWQSEVRQQLDACLARLPDPHRDVVVLRLFEQRSNKEIAELLGLPPNTVAVYYRRALEELGRSLPPSVREEVHTLRRGRGPIGE